jgi:hypothetical protein
MQGPSHLDLAKLIADEHLTTDPHSPTSGTVRQNRMRRWVGHLLISIGERLVPRPTELQLKVSTGPPCP